MVRPWENDPVQDLDLASLIESDLDLGRGAVGLARKRKVQPFYAHLDREGREAAAVRKLESYACKS